MKQSQKEWEKEDKEKEEKEKEWENQGKQKEEKGKEDRGIDSFKGEVVEDGTAKVLEDGIGRKYPSN